ncbi:hypothetical protein L1049_019054 [Liquidambar formosana]|uniref:EF-hand domain-containing protein n=1 Tax=Liquidambar formosana TaxID=63359 RepID=A0AAP0WPK4_LIQFO
MMNSFGINLSLLHKFARTFFHPVNALDRDKRGKGRKPKGLFSGFNWLTSSFAAMEVSNQMQQVFKLIDANGDGKISSFELSEVLLCLGHEKLTATKEAEKMVREVDYNGDGFIDLDEFMDVMSSDGKVGNTGEEEDYLMDAFLIFDSDKNGLISAKELQEVLMSLGFDKCSLQECSRMIKGVDKDGDGFVNFEEFRSMMRGSAS